MRLIYHPDAEAELIDAAQFNEGRQSTLVAQLFDAVDRAVAAIQKAPDRWSIVESDIRKYLIPRFPYAIYYRAMSDAIHILAFKHHIRHPNYWRYRMVD